MVRRKPTPLSESVSDGGRLRREDGVYEGEDQTIRGLSNKSSLASIVPRESIRVVSGFKRRESEHVIYPVTRRLRFHCRTFLPYTAALQRNLETRCPCPLAGFCQSRYS